MSKLINLFLVFTFFSISSFSQDLSKQKELAKQSIEFYQAGKIDDAISTAKEIVENFKQSKDMKSDVKATALINLAFFRRTKIDIEEKPIWGKSKDPKDFDTVRNEATEAESNLREALNLLQDNLETPLVATIMNDLALILQKNYIPQPTEVSKKRIDEAEVLFSKTIAIREKTLGEGNEKTLQTLSNFILLYDRFSNYGKILLLSPKYLANAEKTFGQESKTLLPVLKIYAAILHLVKRDDELKTVVAKIRQIEPQIDGDVFPIKNIISRRNAVIMPKIPVEARNYTDGKIDVTVNVEVNEKGKVTNAVVIDKIHYLIKDAVEEAIKNSTFKPLIIDGKAVAYRGNVPFKLSVTFTQY